MNTTRTGKIARLSQSIRNQLNQQLADGQTGPKILAWLNADPSVQFVLRDHFEGRDVTEKNLSEWRQGGHQDWLRQQETLELASRVIGFSDQLTSPEGQSRLSDRFASILVTELIKFSQVALNEDLTNKERGAYLSDINIQLSRLRRDDHRAAKTGIQKERWERQSQAEDAAANAAYDQEQRRQRIMPLKLAGILKDRAALYGGGDLGHDLASLALEYEFNLNPGTLGRNTAPASEGRVPRVPKIEPVVPQHADRDPFGVPPLGGGNQGAPSTDMADTVHHLESPIAHPPSDSSDTPDPSDTLHPASGISHPASGPSPDPQSEISNPQLAPASADAPHEPSGISNPPIQEPLNPNPTPEPALPPDAIPLANSCSPEEFVTRNLTPGLQRLMRCRPTGRPSPDTLHRHKPAFADLKAPAKRPVNPANVSKCNL